MKHAPRIRTKPARRANDWLDASPLSGLQATTQFTDSIATTHMNHCSLNKAARIPTWLCLAWLGVVATFDSALAAPTRTNEVIVLEKEGRVEAARAGTPTWTAAQLNQALHIADRVRTGERSRATLHLLDQSTLRMFELSEFLIEPLEATPEKPVFSLSKGLLYFFHRDKPVDVQFKTRTATAAIRGTEFHLAVADNGRTVLTMFDGEVDLSNALGSIQLKSGEQGVVEPGQPPVKTPVINAINIIQWCLYYPGVLDVDELHFDANEQTVLQNSIAAYRAGDLLTALAAYPEGRQPVSDSEKVFHAALLLAVGQVEPAEAQLASITPSNQIATALSQLIASVKNLPATNIATLSTNSATALLARSYQLQAQSRLPEALRTAEKSVALAPQFGFGWARVAELEFSFGHPKKAQAALEKSLALAPRNAEAVTLHGFALAAQNHIREATTEFDRAIALDGALGNAWLGRGLCRIRRGNIFEGRDDLQMAATLEPQRALFRSYLGKAWSELGNATRAERELALAKERDVNDPTAWLYSALLLQQNNRINEGIEALERSQELNDNRRVYRSRLLLDQDRAVRGANLANIYRDAGMADVSVREAVKAVNADYANYSAHLFLANSFNDLRDPQGVNLRYETPYVSEYLLANLLAPVGAGTLSQQVSQQEYSKLFERDGVGLSSSTEYSSHGNWRQSAAQYGTFGNSSFAVEEFYTTQHGYRPNSDLEQTEFDFRFKHQFTPKDGIYFQLNFANSSGGNTAQYYDQTAATNAPFRFVERQEPILIAGYHHEWSPGMHSLLLFSRLNDTYSVTNPLQTSFLPFKLLDRTVVGIIPFAARQNYQSELEIYSIEAQQICQTPRQTMVLGTRFQDGGFDSQSRQENFRIDLIDLFKAPEISNQKIFTRFQRWSIYGYEQWHVMDSLRLIGGISYERLVIPENYRFAPLSAKTETSHYLLPKAGVIWTPLKDTTLRAAYAESVGGASFDQSFQLEPTQVAGFNQAFRSLIPESVSGANAGAMFTSYGVSLEQKFPTGTYAAITGELLESTVDRKLGAFEFVDGEGPFIGTLSERLAFRERSLSASLHQLLGRDWALGALYRLSRAELTDEYPEVSDAIGTLSSFPARQRLAGTLQTMNLQVIFQHPSGWFSQIRVTWTHQANAGYQPARPDADFWQWDWLAGYRFPKRRAEILVGLLNFTGQDYRLSPLNLRTDTPRERTFTAQFRFLF